MKYFCENCSRISFSNENITMCPFHYFQSILKRVIEPCMWNSFLCVRIKYFQAERIGYLLSKGPEQWHGRRNFCDNNF